MLDRCRALEHRSAALYRSFAAGAHDQPELSALWTAMAREEEEHSHILDKASGRLPTIDAWLTHISGKWPEVVLEVGAPEGGAPLAALDRQQLAAALDRDDGARAATSDVSRQSHRPPRPIAEVPRLPRRGSRAASEPPGSQRARRLRMCPAGATALMARVGGDLAVGDSRYRRRARITARSARAADRPRHPG
jgi:hypothetical protein